MKCANKRARAFSSSLSEIFLKVLIDAQRVLANYQTIPYQFAPALPHHFKTTSDNKQHKSMPTLIPYDQKD
jgi:hypothetical protein